MRGMLSTMRAHVVVVGAASGIALLVACAEPSPHELTRRYDPQAGNEPSSTGADLPPVVSEDPYADPGDEPADPPVDAGVKDAASTDAASGVDAGSSGGGTSSSGGTPGTCSVTRTGGTGSEPSGVIPVCCAPTATQKAALDELFKLLNQYRVQQGKAALAYDPKLEATVQGHCEHMAKHGFFSHFSPESVVSSPSVRAKLCATTAGGENLAAGQRTPTEVMTGWKNSSGHNANMLSAWKRVGLCRSGAYWGQLFGG